MSQGGEGCFKLIGYVVLIFIGLVVGVFGIGIFIGNISNYVLPAILFIVGGGLVIYSIIKLRAMY